MCGCDGEWVLQGVCGGYTCVWWMHIRVWVLQGVCGGYTYVGVSRCVSVYTYMCGCFNVGASRCMSVCTHIHMWVLQGVCQCVKVFQGELRTRVHNDITFIAT